MIDSFVHKMINCQFFLNLCLILLTWKWNSVHAIQCCLDIACVEKPMDCPSNLCFKFVMKSPGKHSEDRGCMNDLMGYILRERMDGQNPNDDNNDSCQKMETPTVGMILCKCTSNLCNSSLKNSALAYPVWILIIVVVYQFPFVFLR